MADSNPSNWVEYFLEYKTMNASELQAAALNKAAQVNERKAHWRERRAEQRANDRKVLREQRRQRLTESIASRWTNDPSLASGRRLAARTHAQARKPNSESVWVRNCGVYAIPERTQLLTLPAGRGSVSHIGALTLYLYSAPLRVHDTGLMPYDCRGNDPRRQHQVVIPRPVVETGVVLFDKSGKPNSRLFDTARNGGLPPPVSLLFRTPHCERTLPAKYVIKRVQAPTRVSNVMHPHSHLHNPALALLAARFPEPKVFNWEDFDVPHEGGGWMFEGTRYASREAAYAVTKQKWAIAEQYKARCTRLNKVFKHSLRAAHERIEKVREVTGQLPLHPRMIMLAPIPSSKKIFQGKEGERKRYKWVHSIHELELANKKAAAALAARPALTGFTGPAAVAAALVAVGGMEIDAENGYPIVEGKAMGPQFLYLLDGTKIDLGTISVQQFNAESMEACGNLCSKLNLDQLKWFKQHLTDIGREGGGIVEKAKWGALNTETSLREKNSNGKTQGQNNGNGWVGNHWKSGGGGHGGNRNGNDNGKGKKNFNQNNKNGRIQKKDFNNNRKGAGHNADHGNGNGGHGAQKGDFKHQRNGHGKKTNGGRGGGGGGRGGKFMGKGRGK